MRILTHLNFPAQGRQVVVASDQSVPGSLVALVLPTEILPFAIQKAHWSKVAAAIGHAGPLDHVWFEAVSHNVEVSDLLAWCGDPISAHLADGDVSRADEAVIRQIRDYLRRPVDIYDFAGRYQSAYAIALAAHRKHQAGVARAYKSRLSDAPALRREAQGAYLAAKHRREQKARPAG